MWHIYALRDPESLAVRYVGKTSKSLAQRLASHRIEAFRKTPTGNWVARFHRANWLRALYSEGKIPLAEILESGNDDADWCTAEKKWIQHFRAIGADLINGTDGGEGALGAKRTVETKIKASQRAKAQWAKLSAAEKQTAVTHLHTPESMAKRAASKSRWFEDPANIQQVSAYRAKFMAEHPAHKDAAKATLLAGVKKLWSDPELREAALINMRASAKKRRGANSPHAKLTDAAVQDIRKQALTPFKGMVMALARKYQVNKKLINLVIRRKIWVDTPDEPTPAAPTTPVESAPR